MPVWWDCGKVKRFWSSIQLEIEDSLWTVLPFTPQTFLLCRFENEGCKVNRYVVINVIPAASMLLAKLWKDDSVPSLHEWRIKVCQVYLMSKLSAFSLV